MLKSAVSRCSFFTSFPSGKLTCFWQQGSHDPPLVSLLDISVHHTPWDLGTLSLQNSSVTCSGWSSNLQRPASGQEPLVACSWAVLVIWSLLNPGPTQLSPTPHPFTWPCSFYCLVVACPAVHTCACTTWQTAFRRLRSCSFSRSHCLLEQCGNVCFCYCAKSVQEL